MRQFTIFFILVICFYNAYSQDDNLQFKLDSIIAEGDLLYRYEKAVWNSSDLLLTNKKIKKNYGGYVVSHSGDSVFVTHMDNDQKMGIGRYTYISADLNNPLKVNLEPSPITVLEKELLDIKTKIINQLGDDKYKVTISKGFQPNFVLIKEAPIYKLYLIMGTTESDVIPFGNDYLFWSDSDGNITKWKKFHSIMIPTNSRMPGGEKILSSIHSHLKTTPLITATDICTFRLYGELCEMEGFSVLCTATEKYYRYNLKTNSIQIEDVNLESEPQGDESFVIEWPESENWKVGSNQENDEMAMIELIHSNETLGNWTELGCIMSIKGAKNVPMEGAMKMLFDQAKQNSPDARLTFIEKDESAEYPFIIFTIESPSFVNDNTPESQLWFVIQGKESLYTNFRAVKQATVPEELKAKWIAFFKSGKFVVQD